MLLDKEALLRVLDILQPEDFYKENHRLIFESIVELFEEDQACDIVTLVAKLRQKKPAGGCRGYRLCNPAGKHCPYSC